MRLSAPCLPLSYFHTISFRCALLSPPRQTQHCKALAIAARRAMLMSLVQPSPQLLLQFDKVLLMSKGSGTLGAGVASQIID